MTYEERTNLESYLRNINNLIALKKALEESLDYTKYELHVAMSEFDDYGFDDVVPEREIIKAPTKYYTDWKLNQYTDTLKRVMEEILPCWKLIEK